jgi:RHS repeat-associated protein
LVVDVATGAIAQRIDYDEFGRVLADSNPGFQPFGFAGGIWDGDVGLVRFGARDYQSAIGRWTAKDPLGETVGSSNVFGYCLQDPINLFDPAGLMTDYNIHSGNANPFVGPFYSTVHDPIGLDDIVNAVAGFGDKLTWMPRYPEGYTCELRKAIYGPEGEARTIDKDSFAYHFGIGIGSLYFVLILVTSPQFAALFSG